MKKKNLTSFDKFMLNKNANSTITEISYQTEQDDLFINPDYAAYLQDRLRNGGQRTGKVLTEEEYLTSKENGVNFVEMAPQSSAACVEQESNKNKFKKTGKLFLAIYIALMLALAVVVIVKTTIKNDSFADAAAIDSDYEETMQVEAMEEEETEEESNWFDNLCDNLK